MRRPLPFVLLLACGIAADQVSKWLACGYLALHEGRPLLEGILHFTHERNTGVAFSLLRRRPELILAFTAAACLALAWWYARTWRAAPVAQLWTQALLLVGALGNLLDRVRLGYVRDFIDFRPELPLVGHWPVFNLADICLCVGVGLFVIVELKRARSERQ